MIQKINNPVSVKLIFSHQSGKVFPQTILWRGRLHQIIKLGLHHTYRKGRILYHVFSVASKSLFFRLVLNTEILSWKLEEVADGLPD